MPTNIFTRDERLGAPSNRDYGSPFATYARSLYPTTLAEVFNYSEYLALHHGIYAKAIQRAVRYFMTQVEISGTTDYKIRRKYQDYLHDRLGILNHMSLAGDDLLFYGNSFTSVYKPFNRNLICPKCMSMRPAANVDYQFTTYKFKGTCWSCGKKVVFKVKDIPTTTDDIKIIRWNPRTIEMEFHPMSGEKRFFYEPHAKDRGALANGERVSAENTPAEMLEAMERDQKFLFAPGEIYHMANNVPASFIQDTAGWGLPPFLPNFEHVVHLLLLTRYNEAIVLDFLVPVRFFSPPASAGPADPLLTVDANRFTAYIETMWKQHRRDPTSVHTVPFPVQYQTIGGEGRQMAPVELLQLALDFLLSSMGIPQEMYKESLAAGGPPIGLRMFERSWTPFVTEMNKYLNWIVGKCAEYLMWEEVGARLIRTSVYEDELAREMKVNLLSGNKVSNQTALGAFNIDYEYEVDKMLEEQAMFGDKVSELQRDQGQAQQGQMQMDQQGQPPPGGGPPPGAGGPPPGPGGPPPAPAGAGGAAPPGGTVAEVDANADQAAQQIMTMPPQQRRAELLRIKRTDETLHALVMQKLRNYEQAAAQNGLNLTRQGQIPPPGQG